MSSVFEAGIGQLPKAGADSSMTNFNRAHHLSALDDLHTASAELIPSFAHPSPGMRQSYEASSKELSDLTIIGAANAGSRFGNNADAINKFFSGSGGHSEDVANKVDTQLANFVSGQSDTMTVAHNNRFTNNNRHNA